MTFINAGLVAFAALAAIPLAIHLLHRPKPKPQPFPSLMFLKKCARRSRAFSSLKNLVLLALRMGAVALIALSVARPRLAGAANSEAEGVVTALVVDDSYRMAYGEAGLSRFEEARRRALDVLASLPSGAECSLTFASGDSAELTPDLSAIGAGLRRAKPTDLSVPVLPAVVDGLRSLEGAHGRRREIHVFTDLARVAWSGASRESLKALAGVPVCIHDVAKDGTVNAAVTKVELFSSVPRAGRPFEVAATIASWGRSEPLTAVLRIADLPVEEMVIVVPDGGTMVARFRCAPPAGPVVHGTVALVTPDPLAIDDVRHFAAPVGRAPRVLVIEPEPDLDEGAAPFLSYALAPPSLREKSTNDVTVVTPAGLGGYDLGDFDVVFLSCPIEAAAKDLQRLGAWVQEGGGLAVLASPQAKAAAYSAITNAGLYPPVVGETDAPAHLASGGSDGPAFHAFRAGRNGDVTAATFSRRLKFGSPSAWRPAILFDDGTPAVVETTAGRGRLFALPFDVAGASTDLPRYPCFVPMIHEVARYLSGIQEADREFLAGAPVMITLARPPRDATFDLFDLVTGTREPRPADPMTPSISVARALPAGRYKVDVSGASRPFAVNIDATGSDPTRVGREELARLMPDAAISFSFQRSTVSEIRESRFGRELTLAALLAVAFVLLVELWLASRP